jgi:hypothetical protein
MVSMLHETVRVRGIIGNIVPVGLLIFDLAIFHWETLLTIRKLSGVTD